MHYHSHHTVACRRGSQLTLQSSPTSPSLPPLSSSPRGSSGAQAQAQAAMAASLWLQLPSPPLHSSSSSKTVFLLSSSHSSPASASLLCKKRAQGGRGLGSSPVVVVCSSSSPVVTKEDEGAAAAAEATSATSSGEVPAPVSYLDDPNFRGCRGCGREEPERGCNGEGRIQGGIAAVPGFGWWPIKAYRPCPGFLASGGRYRRQGQSMDDVASGRGRKKKPSSTSSSNKK